MDWSGLEYYLNAFDVKRIGVPLVPAIVGLGLAYVLRSWKLLRWALLIFVLAYSVFLVEVVILPGKLSERGERLMKWVGVTGTRIPAVEKFAGDSYLIARLGRENFTRLVVYDSVESGVISSSETERVGYSLVYHLLPLKEYQEDDAVILVVKDGEVISAHAVPNCVTDETLCEFGLTREVALEIARRAGVGGEVLVRVKAYAETGLAVEVINCGQKRKVLIDYRDGKVLASGYGNGC